MYSMTASGTRKQAWPLHDVYHAMDQKGRVPTIHNKLLPLLARCCSCLVNLICSSHSVHALLVRGCPSLDKLLAEKWKIIFQTKTKSIYDRQSYFSGEPLFIKMVYSAFQRKAPRVIGDQEGALSPEIPLHLHIFAWPCSLCRAWKRATKFHRPGTQLSAFGNMYFEKEQFGKALVCHCFVSPPLYPGKFHTCTLVLVWQFQPVARLERMGLHYW